MATNTGAAFNEFYERIVPTSAQSERIQRRANQASDYLKRFFASNHEMPVAGVRLVGSAGRGTDIRPIHDVDVLAEFTNKNNIFEKYRHDSQAFINRIRNTLDAKTQLAQIGTR